MNNTRVVALKQGLLVKAGFLEGNCSFELCFEKKIGCLMAFMTKASQRIQPFHAVITLIFLPCRESVIYC